MAQDAGDRRLVPLIFVLTAIVYYFSAIPLLNDPDMPWHLTAGKWILAHGRIPHTDPWAFTSQGQTPWYLLSWLWDVWLALILRLSGEFGVYLFGIVAGAGLIAFIAARLVALGVSRPAILLTSMLAALGLMEFSTGRPQIIGYWLVVLFAAILHGSRNENRYGRLVLLPLLMLLWVNAHGSFIAGFTVLGAYVAEAFLIRDYKRFRRLFVISGMCAVALCLNPYGLGIIHGIMRTLSNVTTDYIAEWQPFTLSSSIGLSAWMLLFILSSNIRIATVTLADKWLAFAWLLAALGAFRNGSIFILLSAPYVGACLDAQTHDLRELKPPSPLWLWITRQRLAHLWVFSIIAYGLFAVGAFALPHRTRLIGKNHDISDALQYAMSHESDRHFLTDYNLGGLVIYRTGGRLPMFMDSRAGTAYTDQQVTDYISFMQLEPDWQAKIASLGVEGILLNNNTLFAKAYAMGEYRDHWQLVFAGMNASVYIANPSHQ